MQSQEVIEPSISFYDRLVNCLGSSTNDAINSFWYSYSSYLTDVTIICGPSFHLRLWCHFWTTYSPPLVNISWKKKTYLRFDINEILSHYFENKEVFIGKPYHVWADKNIAKKANLSIMGFRAVKRYSTIINILKVL